MWYVIQTVSGLEHEVSAWVNTFVDKSFFRRCFVPLYEDVWRREGIGHITVKKMFPGYIFLDTDNPEDVYEELKHLNKMSSILHANEDSKKFLSLFEEEEEFFDNILEDGMLRVSYVDVDNKRKIRRIIGPLNIYRDNIVKMDYPHRRAIVELKMHGEVRTCKFGIWLERDPKIAWIEEAKGNVDFEEADIGIGFDVGDYVINTTGLYGDTPLEVVRISPDKGTVTVNVMLFGDATRVEMNLESVVLS